MLNLDLCLPTFSLRILPARLKRWKPQARLTGRLLKYEPRSGRTSVLASGIWFANGIALSPDESYIALAETLGSSLLSRVASKEVVRQNHSCC